ncbi:MAG: hypothetical protein E6J90_44315 [Deltaproteobacteria bacterium]|nr:MAG: hypothetical protein E6J90_44315 [Deltaproteobacteria bacterium]
MKKFVFVVTVAAGLVAASRVGRADDVVAYQADGDADAAAADARVAALDEAFARAVSQALGELVDADVRRQNKPVIDRELLGHARLWVTRFSVTREAVTDDRKQVSVSVRIDRDKLRARLAELNIAARDAGEAPAANVPAATAQSVTVLLRVTTPEGVHATYGLAAEKEVAGIAALSAALRRANLVIKRAPASGPAARPDGELPLEDDTAEALAAEAKADLAAVAAITVGPPVPLRGIAANGMLITARVRLIDRKAHKVLGQGTAVSASRGTDPGVVGYAIDRALVAATADVLPQPAQSLAQPPAFTGDDTPPGEPGIVLIRLARATPWTLVQAELKHLLGARGVSRATLRHVSPSGWVIGVATGESIDRIASIVKKPPATDTMVTVKIVGDLIEAAMAGAP